jgi:hypothetical protein
MTIVTTHYRYKRPPRKRKAQAAEIEVLEIVTIPREKLRRVAKADPANDGHKSAIVTAKSPHRRQNRFGDVPDMTPEEHKRQGDAADALFREMKRQIAEKLHKE